MGTKKLTNQVTYVMLNALQVCSAVFLAWTLDFTAYFLNLCSPRFSGSYSRIMKRNRPPYLDFETGGGHRVSIFRPCNHHGAAKLQVFPSQKHPSRLSWPRSRWYEAHSFHPWCWTTLMFDRWCDRDIKTVSFSCSKRRGKSVQVESGTETSHLWGVCISPLFEIDGMFPRPNNKNWRSF